MNGLTVTEYKDIRVLTTQQIAEAYGTNTDTITKNFNRNKDRYAEGKHFICLEGQELKDFKTNGQIDLSLKINRLYLWTEKGAFLHAKSLNTDVAWEVYDRLVDSYFKKKVSAIPQGKELLALAVLEAQKTIEQQNEQIKEMKPKALFADAVATSDQSILVGDLAKLICQNGYSIGQKRLFSWLRENGYLIKWGTGYNMPMQRFLEMGLFEIKERAVNNPDGSVRLTRTTKVTGKGQQYFINKFLGGSNA